MSITFELENIKGIKDEIHPLLEKHYLEVHAFPDKIPLNPDYEKYEHLQGIGCFHLITVRDEGVLVGYSAFMVSPNLHYQDHVYAFNDVIFIDEAYRKNGLADELLDFAESILKSMGASVISYHMKCALPFEGLCKAHGYEKKEYIFMKYVGD